jgi:hypothetical protein
MAENEYTLKISLGSINVEAGGPKEFVEPIYNTIKPLLEKETNMLLKGRTLSGNEKTVQTPNQQFPKKASLRDFYQEKNPTSDIHATALIAFFYSELAELDERSVIIDKDQLVKGFKLCNRPVPNKPEQTLLNTKNFGYLDSAGEAGKYKLNTTGYNLIAHTLPLKEMRGLSKKRITPKKTKKTQKKNKK